MAIAIPRTNRLFGIAAFAAVFAALFFPTFRWMAERFDAYDSFYSHGWLIPFASGWLIWQQRERLARLTAEPSWAGAALLLPALAVHLVATWLDLHFISGFAMIGAVWAVVWMCWGWQTLVTVRFAMLFLLFMVPLPGVLLIATSFHMKLAAASLATWILVHIGIPAVQAGSTIDVPGVSVVVDDTCSGLRSLISLIALSVLWTSIMPRDSARWQKALVVASSIPIALTSNMVRILILVLTAAIYGPKAADGFIHYGSGIVVFGVALAILTWLTQSIRTWSLPSFGPGR